MSIRKRSKTTTVLEIVTAIELPSLDEFCNLFLEDNKCKISKCNETLFNSNKKYIYDTTIALLMNNEARARAIGYDIITTRAQGRELMVHVHDAYKVLYDTIDEKHHTLLPFLNVNRIWDGIGTWQM
tara:strand:+ start:3056 stop:3436 length:381 start_codon:yes stop_codon:yes gene_type:complete